MRSGLVPCYVCLIEHPLTPEAVSVQVPGGYQRTQSPLGESESDSCVRNADGHNKSIPPTE